MKIARFSSGVYSRNVCRSGSLASETMCPASHVLHATTPVTSISRECSNVSSPLHVEQIIRRWKTLA
jgi:hypothetical protein